jgi:1-phosphofructokinase family hexose kinase
VTCVLTVAALTPSLDLTYLVPSLRLGEIHRTSDLVSCAGGKPLNMARAAATVGARVQSVAILGGPTGQTLTQLLAAEGLSVVTVPSPHETRTCVSVAAADTGRLTEVYQEAPEVPDGVWRQFSAALADALTGSTGWLSVSGRAPTGSTARITELVHTGHGFGVRVAVDTHGDALPPALAARPDVVKVNRTEAAELLGAGPDADLLEMARAVRRLSGGIVVLTDGVHGSLGLDGQTALHATAPELVGRYPVGSGDSFLGGLLAVLDRGGDLEEALRLATACGVANALVPGQGHFEARTVQEILPQVRLRSLR